jgi:hypothetical protein
MQLARRTRTTKRCFMPLRSLREDGERVYGMRYGLAERAFFWNSEPAETGEESLPSPMLLSKKAREILVLRDPSLRSGLWKNALQPECLFGVVLRYLRGSGL